MFGALLACCTRGIFSVAWDIFPYHLNVGEAEVIDKSQQWKDEHVSHACLRPGTPPSFHHRVPVPPRINAVMPRVESNLKPILPVYHHQRANDTTARTDGAAAAEIPSRRKPMAFTHGGAQAQRTDPFSASPQQSGSSRKCGVDVSAPDNNGRRHTESEDFSHKPPGADVALPNCATLVYKHDNSQCQSWRDEIESFMVFAGLFSAVLTAFIMESYKWLMVEPDDISADYLRQILALMSHVDVTAVKTVSRSTPLPSDVMTRINGFWFSSLTLSLTSALVGIVSKQWLREFLRDTGHSHQTNLAVRQVKYDGLTEWYVGAVIATIPLLLQTALFLFLAGVIDLLWHLQKGVAVLISILCSSTMLFFLITTILPGVQYVRHHRGLRLHKIYQVPFKSPQAWLFMRSLVTILNFFAWAYAYVLSLCSKEANEHQHVSPYQVFSTWTQFDLDWTSQRDFTAAWDNAPVSLARCLGFIELTFEHPSLRDWIWNCLWHLRHKAENAQYVLQCFRGDLTEQLELTSPDDRLIDDVKIKLDPTGYSRATSEAMMHALLDADQGVPRVETRLEHVIRIFNTFEMEGGDEIPRRIDFLMSDTLQNLASTKTSTDLCLQLFYVAQDLLRLCDIGDADSFRWLTLAHEVIDHLNKNDIRDADVPSPRLFSLEIGIEIADWLDSLSDKDTGELAARVLWAAQVTVMLARRFVKLGPLDCVAAWHPRFPEIYDLVQRVHGKAISVLQDTAPAWTMDVFSLDELTLVRASLEARLEAEKDVGGRRKRKTSAKRRTSQRTDSSGTNTQANCGNIRLSDEPLDGQHTLRARSTSPPSGPDPDTRAVHWNTEPRESKENSGMEEADISRSSRGTLPADEPRRRSPDRGRDTRSDDRRSSSSPVSAGAPVGEVATPRPDVVICGDDVLAEAIPSPSRATFKED
ncbi:uncharacterized protein SCHCODRAFT_02511590 [Schizophyllum commune H4-8]|nr:uncharacterized protein SCHCODRAFT_02511590 [Schizophyllum commune H4-8]KAI5889140.1 hypothetical protein SCHCODRAFT_02511590 [Schizophyllum commune H4-8]